MNVYLIRHAFARSNLPDPSQCPYDPFFEEVERHDCSLTPQGERQAALTGARLAGIRFDAALVSPFHRTLSTAAGILRAQDAKIPIEVLPALVECGAAGFRMMPERLLARIWEDIRLIQPYDLPADHSHTMWLRACRVVEYVKARFCGDENVLIVSHGAFLSIYLNAAFLGLSEEQAAGLRFGAENGSITKLRIEAGKPTVVAAIDETGHLGDAISREPFLVRLGE